MINPFSLVSIFGTTVKKTDKESGKSVIATATGDIESGLDAEVYGHHGFISRPSSKTVGIRLRIGSLSIVIAAYTYGVEPPINEGATKVYSTDANGEESLSIILDSDGKMSVSNSSDNLASCIDDLITEIKNMTTYGSPTSHSVSAITISNLTTISTRIKTILKEPE